MSAALVAFRRRWALNKTDLIRFLQAHGMPAITFTTYNSWEAGVVPKPVYRAALEEALKRIERKLRRERGEPAEPGCTGI